MLFVCTYKIIIKPGFNGRDNGVCDCSVPKTFAFNHSMDEKTCERFLDWTEADLVEKPNSMFEFGLEVIEFVKIIFCSLPNL